MTGAANITAALLVRSRTDSTRRLAFTSEQLTELGVQAVTVQNPPRVRCLRCASEWNPDERATGRLFLCPNDCNAP